MLNKAEIVYRSSLERKMMVVLDGNSSVISWGSENVIIPYFKKTEKRFARYFVDFYMKLQIGKALKEYIVEVKPFSQLTLDAKPHGNKKASTLAYEAIQMSNNNCKWEAAKTWCMEQRKKTNRDIEFIIITEKNIDTILGK